MRFLAEESCDFAVVRALRARDHEVLAVSEVARGATDNAVMRLASDSGSILQTEDKDFGRLFFAYPGSAGVMLIRFQSAARRELGAAVCEAVGRMAADLLGAFVVVEPGRVRRRTAAD